MSLQRKTNNHCHGWSGATSLPPFSRCWSLAACQTGSGTWSHAKILPGFTYSLVIFFLFKLFAQCHFICALIYYFVSLLWFLKWEKKMLDIGIFICRKGKWLGSENKVNVKWTCHGNEMKVMFRVKWNWSDPEIKTNEFEIKAKSNWRTKKNKTKFN